jgi:predicted amidohydrolase
MRLGYVQTEPRFGDVEGNRARALAQLEEAPGDLLVLPELFTSGYRFVSGEELGSLAEPADGPTVRAIHAHCRRRGRWVVGGFPELTERGVFNAAFVVGPDGLLGTYRKVHLFHEEKRWFLPGDGGFPVWELGPVRLGVLICFDWCFPEAARSLAMAGAQVIAHPSNLVLPHAQNAMVTRCLENQLFAITANRVGVDDRGDGVVLRFTGRSQVACPDGTRPVRAPQEGLHHGVLAVDPARADDKWITPANHVLEDRRPELYRAR